MHKKCFAPLILLLCVIRSASAAEDRFFDSAGVRIRYIVEGKGEPVVLIHGFGVNLELMWAETGIIKGLADSYQVIALDNRGHGKSDRPHDPQQYGFRMVDDVIRLMDHLKIAKAHVVGYSLGGRIVTVLLATHPGRLRTAVIGGAGLPDAQGIQEQRKVAIEMADSLEQGKGVGPLIVALAPRGAPPPNAEQIEAVNKLFLAWNDPLAVAAVARGNLALYASEARLRANRVPALALVGDLDPRKTDAENLARVAPHVSLVVIPAANHMNAVGQPEFLKSLRAFLAAHGRP